MSQPTENTTGDARRRAIAAARPSRIDREHVREAYRRWAPIYDYLFGPLTVAGRRQTARHVNQGRGRVLEAGVGTGISLGLYAPHLEIVGFDLSPDMLDIARKRVAREGLDHVGDLIEMDAGALTFPDASFDTVVAMYVLTTVPNPRKVMAELARVCRPGGEVIIVNHFTGDSSARAAVERWLARFASVLGWRPDFPVETILSQPGLVLEERRPLAPFGIFTMLRLRRTEAQTGAA